MNSPEMEDAINKAFDTLEALTQEEFDKRLAEAGKTPLGQSLREAGVGRAFEDGVIKYINGLTKEELQDIFWDSRGDNFIKEDQKNKYTFVEFIAANESKDFKVIEPSWLEWAERVVNGMPNVLKNEKHGGDCTKHSCQCSICQYSTMLKNYYEYCKNEEQWLKDNYGE